MKMKCSICGVKKLRIPKGKDEKGATIHVGIMKGAWDGSECPECVVMDLSDPAALSERRCRIAYAKCQGLLPKDRYYSCSSCNPNVTYDIGEGILY